MVIILIILYPIIKMVLMTFIYKMSAALVEPISDKKNNKYNCSNRGFIGIAVIMRFKRKFNVLCSVSNYGLCWKVYCGGIRDGIN